MSEPRVCLEEIIRSAAANLPEWKRASVLIQLMVEMSSVEALGYARLSIKRRMEELIDGFGADPIQVEVGVDWARDIARYRNSGSTPWAGVNNREDAEAFLETASAEDIRATYELLLQGRPIHDDWSVARAHIASAVSSSERIWRRVMQAVSATPRLRFGSRPAGSDQEGRS
ncbi:MAG: hypothetical protein ACK5LJ_14270 [Paracoccus sp. (in: a-proteobacteria)]